MAEKVRLTWIDIAKGVAIVMVVCIHTDGYYLYSKAAKFDTVAWWYANVVNTACRVCVPLFFMLSGAVILGSPARSRIDGAYGRRLLRVLFPLMIWALIYLVFVRSGSKRLPTLNDVLGILRGKSNYHLWFLYSIAGIYMVVPLLNAYACASGDKGCRTLGLMWLAIVGGSWAIERLFNFSLDPNFTRGLPVYTGYFLLGYGLRKMRPSLLTKAASAVMFVTLTVICAVLTRRINSANDPFEGLIGDYLNPLVIAMSIATYLILLPGAAKESACAETPADETGVEPVTCREPLATADAAAEKVSLVPGVSGVLIGVPTWILIQLGRSSFGIYLSHVIFLETATRFLIKENRLGFRALPIFVAVPVMTLAVTLVSWIFTAIISRVPVVRRIV